MYRSDGYRVLSTDPIYHHLYEFGTTGVFVSMGQPMKKPRLNGEIFEEKR